MAAEAVNPAARRAYARLLRQFHSGRMTNFEYEDRVGFIRRTWGSDDAVDAVHFAQWPAYDDLCEHRMTDAGHRLARRERRWVARCVLFLGSEPAPACAPVPAMTAFGLVWTLAVVVGAITPAAAVLVGFATGRTAVVVGGFVVIAVSWVLAFASRARRKATGERTPGNPASEAAGRDFWPFATEAAFRECLSRPTYLCGCASDASIGRM